MSVDVGVKVTETVVETASGLALCVAGHVIVGFVESGGVTITVKVQVEFSPTLSVAVIVTTAGDSAIVKMLPLERL